MQRPNISTRIGTTSNGRDKPQSTPNWRGWRPDKPKPGVTTDANSVLALHGEDHDPNLAETSSNRPGGPPRVAITKPPPKPRQPSPKKQKTTQRYVDPAWSRKEGSSNWVGRRVEYQRDPRDVPRYRNDYERQIDEDHEREYRLDAWSRHRERVIPREEPTRGAPRDSYQSSGSQSYRMGPGMPSPSTIQAVHGRPETKHQSSLSSLPSTPDLHTDAKTGNNNAHNDVSSSLEVTTLVEDLRMGSPHEESLQDPGATTLSYDSPLGTIKSEETSNIPGLETDERRRPELSTSLKRTFSSLPASPDQLDSFKRRRVSETDPALKSDSSEVGTLTTTIKPESAEQTSVASVVINAEPQVKREPSPDRLPSPIDVDAPPLSLYEQLGLPGRTSGSHRVPRPKFSRSQVVERSAWAEKMSNAIRWVRGNEHAPLEMGNIFWRADGVCFDWSVSKEELLEATRSKTPILTHHDHQETVEAPNASIQQAQRLESNGDANANRSMVIDDAVSGLRMLSAETLSGVAICFLDRYTRCFDHLQSRKELRKAYSVDAIMTLQFNDLPTEGTCPRVGNPRRQGHSVVELAERENGRNLLLDPDRVPNHPGYKQRFRRSFNAGSDAIIAKLLEFDDLMHSPTIDSPSQFQFHIVAFADLGCLLLTFHGELFNRTTVERPSSVVVRFDRTFLLRQNDVKAPSWIDWPWIIINDQMTLFHRPGIICQCSG